MAESSHVLAFWSVMMSLKWRTGLAMLGCCTRKAHMADVPAVCESECRCVSEEECVKNSRSPFAEPMTKTGGFLDATNLGRV